MGGKGATHVYITGRFCYIASCHFCLQFKAEGLFDLELNKAQSSVTLKTCVKQITWFSKFQSQESTQSFRNEIWRRRMKKGNCWFAWLGEETAIRE